MRAHRFDQLAKAVAGSTSRRNLLKATIATLLTRTVPEWEKTDPLAVRSAAASELPPLEYFALGDSVASGHGLMDDGTPCRRSGLAYPYKVLTALNAHYTVPFVRHLACSGATALEPVAPADPNKWFRHQVDEVERQLREDVSTDRPVLVSVTIGANDFGWLSSSIINRLVEGDQAFQAWVDDATSAVAAEILSQVERLLAFPNVVIVLTQYHNPVNLDSVIFRASDQLLKTTCNDLFNPGKCYRRTEDAIRALNGAFVFDVLVPLGSPSQLGVTPTLHEVFQLDGGHEGPGALGVPVGPGLCGFAPPGVANTWVQWPGDPNSNSLSFLGDIPGFPPRGFAGDCFHPNEAGAQQFANAVIEQAFAVLLKSAPPTTTAPEFIVYEVVRRAQTAVADAGTYRYELFNIDESGRRPNHSGEVDIDGGIKKQSAETGLLSFVTMAGRVYSQMEDDKWTETTPASGASPEPLLLFLQTPVPDWTLLRVDVLDGRSAYVIERVFDYRHSSQVRETLWIDAETFLPMKRVGKDAQTDTANAGETLYTDFGAPVDVEVPPEVIQ